MVLGINGRFPGPTIEADVGDILEITVVNKIQDGQNVSLHWHGINQRGTPFEDGAGQISQCPLKQGSTQVYRFPVERPGTYWYHSHVNSQYTEGLWGALIVRGKPEVHGHLYQEEILVTLNDWHHTSAAENHNFMLQPKNKGVPPFPFSVLMNGVGRYSCGVAFLQRRSCNKSLQLRPVFNLSRRKSYRLRLINSSALSTFNFTISGHILRVIEVDGIDTLLRAETTVQAVSIGPGQRYSFLIEENDGWKHQSRFLVRANLRKELLFTIPNLNINPFPEAIIGEVTGVLEYGKGEYGSAQGLERYDYSEKDSDSGGEPWTKLKFLEEMNILPYNVAPPPNHVDKEVISNMQFFNDSRGIQVGSFNSTPFELPSGQPLLIKMIRDLTSLLVPASVVLKYGDIVQVVINNPMLGAHPIHLHGHHFG